MGHRIFYFILTIIHTLSQMLMLNTLFKSKCKTKSLVISSRSVSFILLICFLLKCFIYIVKLKTS